MLVFQKLRNSNIHITFAPQRNGKRLSGKEFAVKLKVEMITVLKPQFLYKRKMIALRGVCTRFA